MKALILTAMFLGQTTGGPGVGNDVAIKNIVPKWKFSAFPANDIATFLVALDYDAPTPLAIPTGQAKTALQCLNNVADQGLSTAFKVPYDQDLVNGSYSYLDWVADSASAGNVRLEVQCYRANVGQVLAADPQFGVTIAAPGVVNQMAQGFIGQFPISGLDLTGMRLCALWRDVDHVDDTYTGNVCILGIVVGHERPVLGNDAMFTR